MKTDLLIRSATWSGGRQITVFCSLCARVRDQGAADLCVNPEAGSKSGPVLRSLAARSQSGPPPRTTDTANEASHLSIILRLRANDRHFLHFITNTMFHWQRHTAENSPFVTVKT